MEQQVRDLEAQIKAAFGIPEMQKQPYHLHSICVHDGNATRDRADVFAATTDTTSCAKVVSVVAANIRQLAGEFAAPV